MRRAIPLHLVVAGCLAALGGCVTLQGLGLPQPAAPTSPPTLTFEAAHVADRSLFGARLDLVYSFHNPGPQAVSLSRVRYTLSLDGAKAFDGSPPESLSVPPNGTAELHVPADVHFTELASATVSKTARYEGRGTVEVQTAAGPVSLPFQHAGEIDRPLQPELSPGAPRLVRVTFPSATLALPLRVRNTNAFPISFSGVEGEVSVLGARVGHAAAPAQVVIAPGAEKTTSVTLDVPFQGLLAAAVEGRVPEVGFDGRLSSGADVLPVRFSERLPVRFQAPQIRFAAPRIDKVSFTSAKLVFPIEVTNPNEFPLPLGAVQGALELAGANVGSVSTQELGLVGAGQQARVELPLEIELLGAARRVLAGGPVSVGFHGQVHAASAVLPLVLNEKLSFQR